MIKASGKIYVDVKQKRVVVNISHDFVRYYQYFIQKQYWMCVDLPMHGTHITISNGKLHKNVNWAWAYKKYHGKTLDFTYNPDIIIGGRRKGFHMFYMMVESDMIDHIKNDIGVKELDTFRGSHITIGSIGKNGNAIRKYWPEPIVVNKTLN